jgi:hypothetical protein
MAITYEEYLETKDYFDKHLLISMEMEREIPTENRQIVATTLKTKAMGKEYTKGDYIIDTDGSVPYGNEIILSGKNFTFKSGYEKIKFAEDRINLIGAKPQHSDCSNHITLFTLFCKKHSPLITQNVLQITRAYTCGLFYISGADRTRITRNRGIGNFCRPIFNIQPVTTSLNQINNEIGKYSIASIRDIQYYDESNLNRFFVEFRQPDGCRIPAAESALMQLHKAIVMKALKESIKGIIHADALIGTDNWKKEKAFCNTCLPSSTDCLAFCKDNAKQLLDFVEKEILELEDGDLILSILKKLAEKSISERYWNTTVTNDYNDALNKELLNGKKKLIENGLTQDEKNVLAFMLDNNEGIENMAKLHDKLAQITGATTRTTHNIVEKLLIKMNKRIEIDEKGRILLR